ncbi:adenylosuccinate lyase [compost metagenome]
MINKDAMYRNVMITNGLINSEKIMMSLVERLGKDMAHELVYEMAMKSTHGNIPYGEILREELVSRYDFSEEEVLSMLDPRQYVGLCATIAEEVAALALETVK